MCRFRLRPVTIAATGPAFDGKIDLPLDANDSHPLTEPLLHDFLVVDVSKPFTEDGYFEIEQAMRASWTPITSY